MGLRTGGRRAKCLKNRVKSSKIELRFREVRSEGCTSCSPVQQALILPYYGFYGSASAEPFLFSRSFPADWGARLRISGGCPGGASRMRISNNCSSIAWAAEPPQRCSPVQQVQQRRPAASGGNREELLGPRPAGYEARPRAEIDAGSRNPGKLAVRCRFSRAIMS